MTPWRCTSEVECEGAFTEVGGRCVHVELSNSGSWHDSRNFCHGLGGELVNLADVQFYSDLILYLESIHMGKMHFWIGATDIANEGTWVWTDGSATRMGTPFWANYGVNNDQMPTGGTDQNCAILDTNLHYYFNDAACEKTYIFPICEK
ncbi:Perlucin-like protein [Portunus trituberculatus]|uniref:Perlucin-like protein n=1 Tax=Portunus trituberculatus TaxID=210409 RepID=A0A5B7K8T2_PORTR|nr:Perlucin-like protein [Portunus trituberculatus]